MGTIRYYHPATPLPSRVDTARVLFGVVLGCLLVAAIALAVSLA